MIWPGAVHCARGSIIGRLCRQRASSCTNVSSKPTPSPQPVVRDNLASPNVRDLQDGSASEGSFVPPRLRVTVWWRLIYQWYCQSLSVWDDELRVRVLYIGGQFSKVIGCIVKERVSERTQRNNSCSSAKGRRSDVDPPRVVETMHAGKGTPGVA